ncbi:hypothetical protein MLGJGCBP_08052 [Rhodococcus sp. T7]|nr:hypothetical protein MLGJGCBP_08963 [Rhodococcus sp. T7]KAF0958858.1 hypothetical protein MLGJGCBP_08052 [Rhodococcus sp. T7]
MTELMDGVIDVALLDADVDEFLRPHPVGLVDATALLRARFSAGFGSAAWPDGLGGRGLPRSAPGIVECRGSKRRVCRPFAGPRNRIGLAMSTPTPTPLTFAGRGQQKRWLQSLWTGEEIWRQLPSEPGTESDLADKEPGPRKRSVDRHRSEGLDVTCAWCTVGVTVRPYRYLGLQACRSDIFRARYAAGRRRRCPAAPVRHSCRRDPPSGTEAERILLDGASVRREHPVHRDLTRARTRLVGRGRAIWAAKASPSCRPLTVRSISDRLSSHP